MNSTNNILPSDGSPRCFLVDEEVDRYRWVGRLTEEDGANLVRVRYSPVASTWRPIGVEWIPETKRRPTCDFPIFYSTVRCFSRRALEALASCINGGLEVLPLDGLDDAYVGVHCIRWLEGAANLEGVDQDKVSIHSANFVPRLEAKAIERYDLFGVPEMITKLFVSERFKNAVEQNGLVGFRFREVPLC
ncbi:double-CXXCG motif protein [Paucibacter sp. B51]|uniref:double-CXXCG motif protein n=1 Tax=Paucibacter sp. B51 TaxID=2993315 RepID=UPI003FA7D3CA